MRASPIDIGVSIRSAVARNMPVLSVLLRLLCYIALMLLIVACKNSARLYLTSLAELTRQKQNDRSSNGSINNSNGSFELLFHALTLLVGI